MSKPMEYGWVHAGTLGKRYNYYKRDIFRLAQENGLRMLAIRGRMAINVQDWNLLAASLGWPLVLDPAIVLVAEEEA